MAHSRSDSGQQPEVQSRSLLISVDYLSEYWVAHSAFPLPVLE